MCFPLGRALGTLVRLWGSSQGAPRLSWRSVQVLSDAGMGIFSVFRVCVLGPCLVFSPTCWHLRWVPGWSQGGPLRPIRVSLAQVLAAS